MWGPKAKPRARTDLPRAYLPPMRVLLLSGLALLVACGKPSGGDLSEASLVSPDESLRVRFARTGDGRVTYQLSGSPAGATDTSTAVFIQPSTLGFELEGLGRVDSAFEVVDFAKSSGTESYSLPWGEVASVEADYEAIELSLKHATTGVSVTVEARLFDDGLGLRYTFYKAPNREALGSDTLRILEELTGFRVSGDPLVNWGPGDWNSYENRLELTPLSEIDAGKYDDRPQLISRVVPNNAVMTPATMRLADGTHLSIHEADLVDYPEMTLEVMGAGEGFRSTLAGSPNRAAKAVRAMPFSTPWRTIAVERRAIDLLDNHLVLNLNPPNELGEVEWFEPTTYAGVWWEMFLGKGTWDLASGQTATGGPRTAADGTSRHAANTANVKRYIDFCAEHDIGGLLVEGWNTGWEVWLDSTQRLEAFDFVTPYPDYDLREVVAYGKSRGVDIVMHHETSAVPARYEQQLDTAFALMRELGLHIVKSGYVGDYPNGEWHHGQYGVRHYRKVFETAARYQVAVNVHEPIKPTGERRTLPNAISSEGARGMEYNAFGDYTQVNQPSHVPGLVYTRCLAGPFDYTPGIFNLEMEGYKGSDEEVLSTLGGQLGSYVVIYAPIQMIADIPESYLDGDGNYHPAMAYLREMATNWDATYPLAGELGEYAVVARKVRGEDRYFVGGVAGDKDQSVTVELDFLPADVEYTMDLYADAAEADVRTNKKALDITRVTVTRAQAFDVLMKRGGGFGAVIYVAQERRD